MLEANQSFAQKLTGYVLSEIALEKNPDSGVQVLAKNAQQDVYTLDLTPFVAQPEKATAGQYFSNITNVDDLLLAYTKAKSDFMFEDALEDAQKRVSPFAKAFLDGILQNAKQTLNDQQASLIAEWVQCLDVYTAVKSVESLLNSRADLALLEIAQRKNWHVHFDHLAIRCGSRATQDAERVVDMLTQHHGYAACQLSHEAFYQFSDGWNALPLYKILENGQVLRLFIDQSDADSPTQIIQHWNRVYGYTAHHLAIRATTIRNGQRVAVSLAQVMAELNKNGVDIMTPTGEYTEGLLLQVFTRPERNPSIPQELKKEIIQASAQLEKSIENGKLLELVSRREMPQDLAREYFALYNIEFQPYEPLHSAPIYQYFLPAQAAHVIRTSVQTG